MKEVKDEKGGKYVYKIKNWFPRRKQVRRIYRGNIEKKASRKIRNHALVTSVLCGGDDKAWNLHGEFTTKSPLSIILLLSWYIILKIFWIFSPVWLYFLKWNHWVKG